MRGVVVSARAQAHATRTINPAKSLFFKSNIPLTGHELKNILQERPVRLSICGNAVTMRVLSKSQEEVMHEATYTHLAGLLNDWCATAVVRDTLQEAVTESSNTLNLLLNINIECANHNENFDIYHA